LKRDWVVVIREKLGRLVCTGSKKSNRDNHHARFWEIGEGSTNARPFRTRLHAYACICVSEENSFHWRRLAILCMGGSDMFKHILRY